jgi:hypothetical protein
MHVSVFQLISAFDHARAVLAGLITTLLLFTQPLKLKGISLINKLRDEIHLTNQPINLT